MSDRMSDLENLLREIDSFIANAVYDDVVRLESHVRKARETLEKREREARKREILRLAKAAGLEVEFRESSGGRRKYGPAKPKYRHPHKPEVTWSGRGVKPRWIRELEQEGYTLEQLRIQEANQAAGAD